MNSLNRNKIIYTYIIDIFFIAIISIIFLSNKLISTEIVINIVSTPIVYSFFFWIFFIYDIDDYKTKMIKLFFTVFFSFLVLSILSLLNIIFISFNDLMLVNLLNLIFLLFLMTVFKAFFQKKFNFLIYSNENYELIVRNIILEFRNKVNKIIVIHSDYEVVNLDEIKATDFAIVKDNPPSKQKSEFIKYCIINKINLLVIPSIDQIYSVNSKEAKLVDLLCFNINKYELNKLEKFIKRLFDLVFSIIALVIFSPLFLIVIILIKLFDKGPVFYYQKRSTINNKTFVLIKFRTMIHKAEKNTGAVFASENDARITKVGKLLRQSRLDELPQLFNIIKGDMSIVGPRPERKYFIDSFMKEEPMYVNRFNVKAGITGLSQINVNYNSRYTDKLRYDLLYITKYSIFLDIKIIFNTLLVMFDPRRSNGIDENINIFDMLNKYNLDIEYKSVNKTIIVKK